jgi:protein-tyrosine phosphatase
MDFEGFDLILAMDEDNFLRLRDEADESHHEKIALFLDFAESNELREVPDPYYGGTAGFERVLDLVEDASRGLLEVVRSRL